MNTKGGQNLTSIMIGIIIFVGVVTLLFSAYSGFMTDNQQTIDPTYSSAYSNITGYSNNLSTDSNTILSTASSAGFIDNIVSNVFAVIVIGYSVINAFLSIPAYVNGAMTAISTAIPEIPAAVTWMVLTIVGIIVGALIIKAKRQMVDVP